MSRVTRVAPQTVSAGWAVAASGSHRRRAVRRGSRGCAMRGGRGRRAITRVRALMVALSIAVALAGMGPRKASAAYDEYAYDMTAYAGSAYWVGRVVYWATVYQNSVPHELCVIRRESGFNTAADNGAGDVGIAQFDSVTFSDLQVRQIADPTHAPGLPYSYDPVYGVWGDPEAEIHLREWSEHAGWGRKWQTEGWC